MIYEQFDLNYKKYIIKFNNYETIISMCCILSSISNNTTHKTYNINFIFHRIKSFNNQISLEFINYILKKKFSSDLVFKILYFYLKKNVSFCKINTKIDVKFKYCQESKLYKSYFTYKNLSPNHKNLINKIISLISDNFLNILNKNLYFNSNNIFKLINKDIDFFVNYNFNSNNKKYPGWSLECSFI